MLLKEVIELIEQEAREAGDGTENLDRALKKLNVLRQRGIEQATLDKVFERLDSLMEEEEEAAEDALGLVREWAPHLGIHRDLGSLTNHSRNAELHSRVAGAYRWAKHSIRIAFKIVRSFEEHDEALKTHPTKRP